MSLPLEGGERKQNQTVSWTKREIPRGEMGQRPENSGSDQVSKDCGKRGFMKTGNKLKSLGGEMTKGGQG